MAELTTIQLNAESHLLLDQPLLRLPYELTRKDFKSAQREIERETKNILASLKTTTQNAMNQADPTVTLANIDSMLARLQKLKKKLEALRRHEKMLHQASRRRLEHLQNLYGIESLGDVKYDEWSRVRLNRLLVDYFLRMGFRESAIQLAKEKNIEELVDVEAFESVERIERSLREGKLTEALNWCTDNKQSLKKMGSNFEFELRLQQFIEMVRSGEAKKLQEATLYARKHLAGHSDTTFVARAAGLLAYPPNTPAEPYKSLYSPVRWQHLSTLFLRTHHTLLSLPSRPLLHIALSAGLSALKTPSCHSRLLSSSTNSLSTSTSVCPICSTELNELARNVPYAHHTKSYVENDPVVLPNGRVYGKERLQKWNEKVGTRKGLVRDLLDKDQVCEEGEVRKVFIS